MIVIRNQKELKSQISKIKKELISSLQVDIESLKEFDKQSEEYGPLIILMNVSEEKDLLKQYPILDGLNKDDEEIVYEDEKEVINRELYLLTDSGFIIYKTKEKSDVQKKPIHN